MLSYKGKIRYVKMLFALMACASAAAQVPSAAAGGAGETGRYSPSAVCVVSNEEQGNILGAAAEMACNREAIAQRTLGSRWLKMTSEQRAMFSAAFGEFLKAVYMNRLSTVLADRAVSPEYRIRQVVDGCYALVENKQDAGETVRVQYKLIKKAGVWSVYDLSVNGVGLVADYRAQCDELLARTSLEKLCAALHRKTETVGTQKKKQAPPLEIASCETSCFSPSIIMDFYKINIF